VIDMEQNLVLKLKPFIQPFERKLAMREVEALTGCELEQLYDSDSCSEYGCITSIDPSFLLNHLAYWEHIRCSDETSYTLQVLRESTVNAVRNGVAIESIRDLVSFDKGVPVPNRRCLRYGTHGIHEYRGKFFPQLVRSLINIGMIPADGVIADPMCGSGTTIVEAVLAGRHGIGMDMNPLSVMMSRTKSALLSVNPDDLGKAYQRIRSELLGGVSNTALDSSLTYFSALSQDDQEYLKSWFSDQVLRDLDRIAVMIGHIDNSSIKSLMWICLSNILREVSWQKTDDLRVRREVRLDVDIDPIREFLEESGRTVRLVLALLYRNVNESIGSFDITEGDASDISKAWSAWEGKVDTIITSPPYATALPYLDTDRLSLCYLGLLPRGYHRGREKLMIGNREITDNLRKKYWEEYLANITSLPESVVLLINNIETRNSSSDVGFRRKNTAALLARYFLAMSDVFIGMKALLKPGATCFVVVGSNHTVAGGERVEINTPDLLTDIAANAGLTLDYDVPMEMLISRDIFKKNRGASEAILAFRK